MRLVVDRIRDAEAAAMGEHLRAQHPDLGASVHVTLGDVLEHYRVTPSGE